MREGKFDRLPRRGRIDLEEYFKQPAELRMAYSILKSAGCVPEEVELLRELGRLQEALAAAADESDRQQIALAIRDTRLRLDLMLERTKRQRGSGDAVPAE
jgi:hypothetical protein